MAVEVRDAAAGGGVAEIEAHVDPVSLQGGREDPFPEDDLLEKIRPLVRVEVLEIDDFPVGTASRWPGL